MGEVVAIRERLRDKAVRDGLLVRIETREQAVSWGQKWQQHAQSLEALLALITAQRDASDLLLEIAEAELIRLKGE